MKPQPHHLSGPQRLSADEFALLKSYRSCSAELKSDVRLYALAASHQESLTTPVLEQASSAD